MSERVMEGSWNPGGPGTSTGGEAWPLPVECLMNGMLPSASSDGHLALFGNGLVLPPQFRQRFPIHFPGPGQLGGHHHGPLSLLSIPPQHSMVEPSDPSSLVGPGSDTSSGQEAHPQPLNLNSDHHHGLDDSEEGSEDDEDDDDVSEEEMDDQVNSFVHPHDQQQQVTMATMSHPSLAVNEDSLPSCQHSQQQPNGINGDSLQSNLIPGMDESCHQKNSLLPNGLSHRHPHEEDIPTMSHGHPLNSNPISAIPMITGNPLLLSDSPEDEFSENPPPPRQHDNDSMDGDPSTGHSVHGKMYVEGRVVFHLKQWTDSGFGSFNSCREQDQQKSQLHRCAVCRLKSPNGQDNLYSNQQKDAHRHPVKGVLFTFEDCIIVELYPEQLPVINCSSHPHPLDPKQNGMEAAKGSHPMPITSYLNPSVDTHNGNQMETIVVSNIPLNKPTTIEQPPEDETQGQSWWDEFDSQRAEPDVDSSPDPSGDMHQSSCIMNLKLEAQSLQHPYQQQHPSQETQEKSMAHDGDSNNGMNDYHFKWKCDRCAIGFMSSDQFESHQCLASMNVSEPEPVDTLEPEFSQNEVVVSTESTLIPIPNPTTELDETHEMVEVDEDLDVDVKPSEKVAVQEDEKSTQELKSAAKYPCTVCKKSFNLKKMLKQHLQEQHEANPLRCTQCKTQYTDEKRLKRHSCTLSVQSLNNHQHRAQSQLEASIIVVNDVSEDETDLNERDDSDSVEISNKKPLEIEVLTDESNDVSDSQSSKRKSKKSEHSQMRLKKKKFKPVKPQEQDDGRSRRSRSNLRSPNKKVDETGEMEDEDYDYEMQTRFLNPNAKGNQGQTENRSKKGFKCNICGKCFTVERRLLNHKASHKTDRSSQCEKCGKKFARKDKLMRHMYVHSEEKMFVCDICEKRFSRRDKLTDHMKSHGTDEIHNCPMCQKQFLRPDILKQHVKLHRMGNKHQCPECLRFVTGKDRLTKHMARHEEAKALGQTLLCPLCTKYFIQRQSLKAHIKKFHPDALVQLESDSGKFDGTPDSPGSSNDSSEDNTREAEVSPKSGRTNVTTVCLLLEDVMGTSKTPSNKPKPFTCLECSQTFSRKQALRKHMLIKHPSSRENGQSTNGKKSKHKKDKIDPEEDEDVDESKDGTDYQIQSGKSEESNPSSLSSLSTSSSPPIQLMSMSSILQQPEHRVQMSNSQITLNQQDLNPCSSISGDLRSSEQSHLSMLHSSGSLHQLLPQQAHISAYSHHLALASMSSMVTVNGNPSTTPASTIQQSMETVGDTGHSHPQQLGSVHSGAGLGLSINHHHMGMGGQPGVMCPSSSYLLNYPPYHYQ